MRNYDRAHNARRPRAERCGPPSAAAAVGGGPATPLSAVQDAARLIDQLVGWQRRKLLEVLRQRHVGKQLDRLAEPAAFKDRGRESGGRNESKAKAGSSLAVASRSELP